MPHVLRDTEQAGRAQPSGPHERSSELVAAGKRACIVVPAFQAAASIGSVLSELLTLIPEARGSVIVVDDGSRDDTASLARREGAHVVAHSVNLGKGAAIVTGLTAARAKGFEVALVVDADGQHPALSARTVLHASEDPRALVLAIRDLAREGAPRKNQLSNRISNYFLSRFADRTLRDTQCGLRRYPVRETLELSSRARGYAYEAEVLLRAIAAGLPIVEVGVHVVYPPEEQRVTHFHSVKDPARIIVAVVRTVRDLRRRGKASIVR